jgi:hypothetical protein
MERWAFTYFTICLFGTFETAERGAGESAVKAIIIFERE